MHEPERSYYVHHRVVLASLTVAQHTITLKLVQDGIATIRYDPAQVRNACPRPVVEDNPQHLNTPQDNPALQALLPLNITAAIGDEAEYADAQATATPVRPQNLLDAALGMPIHHRPPTPCDALLHIPKVALMFLTPGRLTHERLWTSFFSSVTGALPAQLVHREAQGGWFGSLRHDRLRAMQRACGSHAADTQRGWVDRQFLFTVYVHHHPRFPSYSPDSLFYQREIPILMTAKRYAALYAVW